MEECLLLLLVLVVLIHGGRCQRHVVRGCGRQGFFGVGLECLDGRGHLALVASHLLLLVALCLLVDRFALDGGIVFGFCCSSKSVVESLGECLHACVARMIGGADERVALDEQVGTAERVELEQSGGEGRALVVVLHVDVGARLDENGGAVVVVALDGPVESRAALVVGGVHGRVELDEQLDESVVRQASGHGERRVAELVVGLRVDELDEVEMGRLLLLLRLLVRVDVDGVDDRESGG